MTEERGDWVLLGLTFSLEIKVFKFNFPPPSNIYLILDMSQYTSKNYEETKVLDIFQWTYMDFGFKEALKHKKLASKTSILQIKVKYSSNSKVSDNNFSHEFHIFGQPLYIFMAQITFTNPKMVFIGFTYNK